MEWTSLIVTFYSCSVQDQNYDKIPIKISSIIQADQPGFLRGREGAGGGAHILRGRTLIRISCPDWSNSVRTLRDVHYSRALIGQTAYVHPVTYAIAAL